MFLSDLVHGSSPPTPLGSPSSVVNATPGEDSSSQEAEEQGGQPSTAAQPFPCRYCALIV